MGLAHAAKSFEVLRERFDVASAGNHGSLSSWNVLAGMRLFKIIVPHAARRRVTA